MQVQFSMQIKCKSPVTNRVNSTKYSGIIFDQHLQCFIHISIRILYAFYNMEKMRTS